MEILVGAGEVALIPAVLLGDLELVVGVFVDLVHLRLGDVHLDAAQRLADLREPGEVDHHVLFNVHAQKLVDGLHRQFRPAEVVGGVEAIGAVVGTQIGELHGHIAHQGGKLDLGGPRIDRTDDHRIRTAALALHALVNAQQQYILPFRGEAGVDREVGNLHHLFVGQAGDLGVFAAQQIAQRRGGLRLSAVFRLRVLRIWSVRRDGCVRRRSHHRRRSGDHARINRIGVRGPRPPDEQHHGDDDERHDAEEGVKAAADALAAALRRRTAPGSVAAARGSVAGGSRAGGAISRRSGTCGPRAAWRVAPRRGICRSLRRPTICHEIHLLYVGLHIRYHYTHLIPGNQLDLPGIRAANAAMR